MGARGVRLGGCRAGRVLYTGGGCLEARVRVRVGGLCWGWALRGLWRGIDEVRILSGWYVIARADVCNRLGRFGKRCETLLDRSDSIKVKDYSRTVQRQTWECFHRFMNIFHGYIEQERQACARSVV